MKRLPSALIILSLLLAHAATATAQDIGTAACQRETYARLSAAQRQFRATLLGQKRAAQLPASSVRYDRDGNAWMKQGNNQWRSLAAGFEGTTWSDMLMDSRAEFTPRRGILETEKILTSELLPSILQAFRAMQCETRAVCEAAIASQSQDAPDPVRSQPIGCIEFTFPRFNQCRERQTTPEGGEQRTHAGDVEINLCEDVRTMLLSHEEQVLAMMIAYDSSYRSLLQFAGHFDDFLAMFREPLLLPLWQTLHVFQNFTSIPCFNAQCDE